MAAYRATRYVFQEFVLRVDAVHPALDAWLAEHGQREWAFLTAWNPGSRPRAPDENARDQERLKARLSVPGLQVLPATGEADDGSWSEPSLFVAGLPHDAAERLGRDFGQVAVLVGHIGGPAELRLCVDPREQR